MDFATDGSIYDAPNYQELRLLPTLNVVGAL